MDVKHLENFLLITEQGSFSRAASIIGVAQPALGRQVKQLEALCGTKLFYRHGRGITLTQEGVVFADRIRPLLQQLHSTVDDMRKSTQCVSGTVIVGMTPTMESLLGFPLLQTLKQTHPAIKIHFRTGYSAHVHEWLLDGRLDIAIVHGVGRSQHIAVEPLARLGLFLVSHPDLAKVSGTLGKENIPFSQLSGLDLALPGRPHGLRRTLDIAAEKSNIDLRVKFELDTLSLMKEAALAGACHIVLAMPGVDQEVKKGSLVASAITEPELYTRMMVATSVSRPHSLACKAVLAILKPLMVKAINDAAIPMNIHLL